MKKTIDWNRVLIVAWATCPLWMCIFPWIGHMISDTAYLWGIGIGMLSGLILTGMLIWRIVLNERQLESKKLPEENEKQIMLGWLKCRLNLKE